MIRGMSRYFKSSFHYVQITFKFKETNKNHPRLRLIDYFYSKKTRARNLNKIKLMFY